MQLPNYPTTFLSKEESGRGCFLYTLCLVVFGYVGIPRSVAVAPIEMFVLGITGVLLFFLVSFLIQQPPQFLWLRSIALMLLGAGILAPMSFICWAVELLLIDASRDRSFAVAGVMLILGMGLLGQYWLLNLINSQTTWNVKVQSLTGRAQAEVTPSGKAANPDL